MTCGIYKLNFKGTSKVYIGQSVNIEKRYKRHIYNLLNGTATSKLLDAYSKYGTPKLEILLECTGTELDTVEEECIDIWDSVDNGFNTYKYADQAPINEGFGSGNSKYTKDQILHVFDLLVTTNSTYLDISNITGVPQAVVTSISIGNIHLWLKELYPEKYSILSSKHGNRNSYNVISDKLSAKSKGIVYPNIKSPEGIIYTIDNAYKFAKQHGLAPNHFQEVLNGHRKSHKGWKVCPEELVSVKH